MHEPGNVDYKSQLINIPIHFSFCERLYADNFLLVLLLYQKSNYIWNF